MLLVRLGNTLSAAGTCAKMEETAIAHHSASARRAIYRGMAPSFARAAEISSLFRSDSAAWNRSAATTASPRTSSLGLFSACLLYTSDAADDLLCVDLGGRRI